jgi:hypothetical protein
VAELLCEEDRLTEEGDELRDCDEPLGCEVPRPWDELLEEELREDELLEEELREDELLEDELLEDELLEEEDLCVVFSERCSLERLFCEYVSTGLAIMANATIDAIAM